MSSQETASRHRPLDITATILLLIGHAVLQTAIAFFVALAVMGTDPCGYVKCGDQKWAWIGPEIAHYGGWILVIADVAVSIFLIVKGRVAWFVPVGFAFAGIVLGVICRWIISLAGPV